MAIAADLEDVIMACLRKDPDERPTSAREMIARLQRCQDAGRWTQASACAWWSEHGDATPDVERVSPEAETLIEGPPMKAPSDAPTISVDVSTRLED